MHGIGIENEVFVVSNVPQRMRLLSSNSGDIQSFFAFPEDGLFRSLMNALSELKDVFTMDVERDTCDGKQVIELITKKWKNRKIHEYVRDLVTARQSIEFALNSKVIPSILYSITQVLQQPSIDKQTRKMYESMSKHIRQMFDQRTELFDRGCGHIQYMTNSQKSKTEGIIYTGSYHINVTLPHNKSISDEDFQIMHLRVAMMLQWIEPLLLSVIGTPSPLAPLSGGAHTSLSIRLQDEGLAMLLGRDLMMNDFASVRFSFPNDFGRFRFSKRYFHEMFTKYERHLPKWIKMMSADTKPKNFTEAHSKIVQKRSYMGLMYIGTDFRKDQEKGKRFGFEFRMLDNFSPEHLEDVLRLLIHTFDHGLSAFDVDDIANNAFQHSGLNQFIFNSVVTGWATKVPRSYSQALSRIFQVQIPNNSTADVVLGKICDRLFQMYNNKGYCSTKMMQPSMYADAPRIPNINRTMWEMFFQNRFPDVAEELTVTTVFSLKELKNKFPSRDFSMDESRLKAYWSSRH